MRRWSKSYIFLFISCNFNNISFCLSTLAACYYRIYILAYKLSHCMKVNCSKTIATTIATTHTNIRKNLFRSIDGVACNHHIIIWRNGVVWTNFFMTPLPWKLYCNSNSMYSSMRLFLIYLRLCELKWAHPLVIQALALDLHKGQADLNWNHLWMHCTWNLSPHFGRRIPFLLAFELRIAHTAL